MKKSKFLALGVIVLLLVGGLVLASCQFEGCDTKPNCYYKSGDDYRFCGFVDACAVGESVKKGYGQSSCDCNS